MIYLTGNFHLCLENDSHIFCILLRHLLKDFCLKLQAVTLIFCRAVILLTRICATIAFAVLGMKIINTNAFFLMKQQIIFTLTSRNFKKTEWRSKDKQAKAIILTRTVQYLNSGAGVSPVPLTFSFAVYLLHCIHTILSVQQQRIA